MLCVSAIISGESEKTLTKMGYSLIKILPCNYLETAVSSHPDMFISSINGLYFYDSAVKEMFTFLDVDSFTKRKFVECNREVPKNKILEYPNNISFNCVGIGNNLICNERYTCKSVLEYAYNSGMKILNVKQGYAKCSTCVVNENSIITVNEEITESGVPTYKNFLKSYPLH